jgi:hypothetical protein
VPMLIAGAITAGAVVMSAVDGLSPTGRMLAWLTIVVIVGGLLLAAGLAYSRVAPSPYVGRTADILDVIAIMALLPLAAGVVGVYQALQGVFAGVG